MVDLDDLEKRVDSLINEFEEITNILDEELDSLGDISFQEVKEIENTIMRLQRQGLRVTDELKELKLNLVTKRDRFKKILSLKQSLMKQIRNKNQNETPKPSPNVIRVPGGSRNIHRKDPEYERPLGSRGYTILEDYLIPVIKLMNQGYDHKEAFQKVSKVLDVRYNTVRSQCTRGLGLTTDEFVSKVKNGKIVRHLENKFPDKHKLIDRELGSLNIR